MLAAVLATDDLRRLYAALSLLVSTAAAGEEARGLVSFAALEPLLLEPAEAGRAGARASTPGLSREGRERFATTLGELRTTAAEVAGCELWACAAAVECSGADRAIVEDRLAGVISTPRFLTAVAGARLVAF